MSKHADSRTSPLIAAAIGAGAVLLLLLGVYGLVRLTSQDEVMGRVEVAGTDLGGLDRDQALSALTGVEQEFLDRPAIFMLDGKVINLEPRESGLHMDIETMVDEALSYGRTGGGLTQFGWWFTHIFATESLPIRGSVDDEAMTAVFDMWDAEVIGRPISPGAILLVDGELTPSYPETGTGVERPAAQAIVTSSLLAVEPIQAEIPTVTVVPTLTAADVDAALGEAVDLLSASIRLRHNGSEAIFTVAELKKAFRSETILEPAQIVFSFDPEVIDEQLEPMRSEFEEAPVDARFTIEGDSISIIPGKNGTLIDAQVTADRLLLAGRTADRFGELPIVEGADPEVTTQYLEGLQVEHLVSQFTTYHDCCQDRVVNIHRIADEVDMTLVLPGETFSLNGHVGQRTEADGYRAAGTIIAGEIEDTVGGGVSQFTTTMYNAVFWGGYEDVEHKPHSYYFSRYPEGIEATLNWRTPDLKFRNNRDHAVLIDTTYTDTSITVRFFGSNDGRTLKGEQSGGSRKVWVDKEGGPNALHVKGSVSDRYAFTDPGDPRYKPNPDLSPESPKQTQSEAEGWSVTVTRTILLGGVEEVESQQWTVRYSPRFAVIEVHPCKMPGSTQTCPTTTTTTIPPTTTTSSTTATAPLPAEG